MYGHLELYIIVLVSLALINIILILITIITIVIFALHTHFGQIGLTQLTPSLKVF